MIKSQFYRRQANKQLFATIDTMTEAASQMALVISILTLYNCRAREVLNATWENYHPRKFLILHGSKGSSNVVIRDRILLHHIDKMPHFDAVKIFPAVNYWKLYRYVKKNYAHIFYKFKKGKNLKVTHGFRYLNVSNIDIDTEVRDILHHRSIKSGKYYKQSKRST